MHSIGLFYTTIRVWDNRHLLIPNKLLSDRIIENYTLVDAKMAAVVTLRLSYAADFEAVRSLLLQTARDHPSSLPEPEPVVQVIDADNFGLLVRLTVWALSQSDAFAMAADIREAVTAKLDPSDVGTAVTFAGTSPESAGELSLEVPGPVGGSEDLDPGPAPEPRGKIWGLDRNVFFAGVASFFMDVSSEMVYSLVPIFLSSVLGVNKTLIGVIEGIAETTASLVKLFAGWLSDRLGRRKPLMLFGYSLSTAEPSLSGSGRGMGDGPRLPVPRPFRKRGADGSAGRHRGRLHARSESWGARSAITGPWTNSGRSWDRPSPSWCSGSGREPTGPCSGSRSYPGSCAWPSSRSSYTIAGVDRQSRGTAV